MCIRYSNIILSKNRFQDKFSNRVQSSMDRLQFSLNEDRLTKLEEKAFKSSKTPATLNQQLLLLEELGILQQFVKLGLSNLKLAELLSVILNGDKDNIRKALTEINSKKAKSKTATNYAFIQSTFEKAGLPEKAKQADKEYNRLKDLEDNKK